MHALNEAPGFAILCEKMKCILLEPSSSAHLFMSVELGSSHFAAVADAVLRTHRTDKRLKIRLFIQTSK